ncbi:MAG: aldo/keto reductase [Bacteroidota bacterium]
MEYRRLGKTDLEVSYMALGTSSLGGVFQKVKEIEAIQTVFTALDNGINFIDTAPAYGDLKAEKVLGKALKQIKRDQYFLSTKTGKYSTTDFDYSYERIIQEVEESFKRLGVDYVDILHLHDFEFQNGVHREQALNEGYRALQDLKKQGKTRYIGIGIYPVDWCQEIMKSHDFDAMICHNHHCLNDDRILDALDDFKASGTGFINAAPMAMGLLTRRGPASWHPIHKEEEDLALFQTAVEFCLQEGTTIERLAIQYAFSNADIPTTLVSTPKPEQILENIDWATKEPDWDLVDDLREFIEPVFNKDWIVG